MPSASAASNVFFSDDLPEASGSNYQLLNKISPVPLGPYSTVKQVQSSQTSSQRRGVAWSEKIDNVKLFYKLDSIHPSPESPTKTAPPPSIRSYLHEQDLNTASTPQSTPLFRVHRKLTSSPLSQSSNSPSLPRSILKPGVSEIRVASSVEEGGWLNKEPARLLVCGKRPRLVARDSFQVAKMREAAGEAGAKGKGKAREDPPPADETPKEGTDVEEGGEKDGESEEEEEAIEEGGALMTASLVDIILNGAEDLLTLEEAYTTLTLRLRAKLSSNSTESDIPSDIDESIRVAVHPVREEAPAIVRALQRDIGRLLGKLPGPRFTDRESSPFHALQPLRDMPTPSPTPEPSTDSPKRRQGYTEAEIRYRREAAGVGQSALKFLAVVFRAHQLYDCFSEADLTALLDQAMIIPRTAKMPTLHPKRSYRWSIFLLSQMRIPVIAVGPVQDKVVSAVEAAMTSALVPAGCTKRGKEDEEIRKEGIRAAMNIVSTYPSLFLPHYSTLLPPLIKGMYEPVVDTRISSSAACAAFATAKLNIQTATTAALLRDPSPAARQEWQKAKALAQKLEFWVSAHLKMTIKDNKPLAERKTPGDLLVKTFRERVGAPDGVMWCCAAMAVLISLMGGAYPTSGPTGGIFDYIMDITANTSRPALARMTWNHAIHAYLSSGLTSSISPDGKLIRSYKPFHVDSEVDSQASETPDDGRRRINLLQLPVNLGLQAANAPDSAEKVLYTLPKSSEQRYMWRRTDKSKNRLNSIVVGGAAASVVIYAYTGVALQHQDQPAKDTPSEISAAPAEPASTRTDRLSETWDRVVRPILNGLLVVEGIDSLKVIGWQILQAITSTIPPATPWTLDYILSARYLNGQAFAVSQETTTADFVFDLEGDAIKPSAIPAWGAAWVVKRLPDLLDVLQEAMVGVNGVDEVGFTGWIRTPSNDPVLPSHVMRVWANVLRSLASVRSEQPEQPEAFAEGVHTIVQRLVSIWEMDPLSYLPVGVFGPLGCTQNFDETRLTLISKLLDLAIDSLGRDTMGGTSALLSVILRSPSLSPALSEAARTMFSSLLVRLFDIGKVAPDFPQLLRNVTENLPGLFERDEPVQLDIWRLLARTWRDQPEQGSPGAMYTSLLVAPFRHTSMRSAWHARASEPDLRVWTELLEIAVQRSRAEGAETNAGVLDEVARQLNRFFEQDVEASASTISLSCLSAMVREMAVAMTEHKSTHIPLELISIITTALLQAHEQFQSPSPGSEPAISPGVGTLIQALTAVYTSAPAWSASHLLTSSATDGICAWLGAATSTELCASLDTLYCAALDLLSRAITSGDISPSGENLDAYSKIYGPRLSLAGSVAVLVRFQRFWREAFADVQLELSEDVREFLLDVMAAMPGLIEVKGLEQSQRMSEEESQRRFPHSQGLVDESPLVPASDPVENGQSIENALPGSSPEYDADVSTSFGLPINDTIAAIPEQPALASPMGSLPPSSPVRIEDSSDHAEEPKSDDVFGPASMVGQRKRSRRPSKTRIISATQSLPDVQAKRPKRHSGSLPAGTVIPDSQDGSDRTEEDDDVEMVEQKIEAEKEAGDKPTIFGRLLTKATSFGFFSSPSRKRREPDFEIVIPASDVSPRTKRQRNETPIPASDPGPRHSSSSKKSRSSRSKRSRTESGSGTGSGSSRSSSRSGSVASDAIVISDDEAPEEDEEDEAEPEVLPSPGTANRLRAEKLAHNGILHKSKLQPPVIPRPKSRSGSKKAKVVDVPPPTQGRYDDATEESLRLPKQALPLPQASPARTTQQARILSMVEEAARAKAAVESLDFDGVMNLLRHVNELRDAATANLQERAIRERGARRQ